MTAASASRLLPSMRAWLRAMECSRAAALPGADVRKLARDYNVALYELEKAAQRAMSGPSRNARPTVYAANFAMRCVPNSVSKTYCS